MKKVLIAIALMLLPGLVMAQSQIERDLVGVHMPDAQADLLGNYLASAYKYNATAFTITAETSDAADSKSACISGGGACTAARGGRLVVYGEQHGTSPGDATLASATAAGNVYIVSAAGSIQLQGTTSTTGAFTSSKTTDLGWTRVNVANTACNTTCTSACVFGWDTAAPGVLLACTDPAADSCLCAGAS